MSPKVTFIVPCYNLGHLLSDCINSILVQTFQDFEILIMVGRAGMFLRDSASRTRSTMIEKSEVP